MEFTHIALLTLAILTVINLNILVFVYYGNRRIVTIMECLSKMLSANGKQIEEIHNLKNKKLSDPTLEDK